MCPSCRKPTEICITGPAGPSKGRPSGVGRRRALLVGVNYRGSLAELKGCVNDVRNIHKLLTETYRWPASCIRTLTDEDTDRSRAPTKANIQAGLRWLAKGEDAPRPGDVLFFHFSGHGAQRKDPRGLEEDGMNETILPIDFQSAGMITDDEVTELAVSRLPEFAKLTVVMDCCHSGTGLDLPFVSTKRGWKQEANPWFHPSDVQLFSGCEDSGTSADVSSRYRAPSGAMTSALCDVLRRYPNLAYPQLIQHLTDTMKAKGFAQRPQLSSSQQFSFDRPFNLDEAVENRNGVLGRVVNQKFKPQPREFAPGDPLGVLLSELGLSPSAAELAAAAVGVMGDFFKRMSR